MEDNQSKQLKVVIVEDNPNLSEIYKIRLELIGYKCYVARDGEAAMEVIEREVPDLVLLDMMVPKIAGDEILRRMRESEWGKDIRVYVISNLNEADAPRGLRDYGIEGYTVKSNLSDDQLDQLVDNILRPAGQQDDPSLEKQLNEWPDERNEEQPPGHDAYEGYQPPAENHENHEEHHEQQSEENHHEERHDEHQEHHEAHQENPEHHNHEHHHQ